jgi:T5SS/PEP-CTERM-associated repeat protein
MLESRRNKMSGMHLLRISILSSALTCALLTLTAPAAAQTPTFWTDGTDDWFKVANWSAGIPNSNTDGVIDNGGTAQVSDPGAVAFDVELGFNTASDSGAVTVDGDGRLTVRLVLGVGVNGTGRLDITNGGAVSINGGFVSADCRIGEQASSTGAVTVDGTGSTLTIGNELHVGFFGVGTLNITHGGGVSCAVAFVGDRPGSHGTVTVDGVGSTWINNTNGFVWFIGDAGTGSLTITNGATVSFNTQATLGEGPDSRGDVIVDGAGSTWTPGAIMVGDFGSGSLQITNGGRVSSFSDSWIGYYSSGTVVVDGPNSTWNHSGIFVVGNYFTGSLLINNGGTVSVSGDFGCVACNSGSQGTLTVSGAASHWSNSDDLFVGGSPPHGAGGTGTLHVEDGGTVSAANLTVYRPGAVSGSGSIATNAGTTIEGTLAPDHTISFSGNLIFNDVNATMVSTVTPTTADNIVVGGAATLGGHLSVTLSGGPFQVGTQYTLLEAGGGLNGTTFCSISMTFPPNQGFHPEVMYDADHVYVILEAGQATPTPAPTCTPTATPRLSPTARPRPTPRPRLTLPR